MSRLPLLMSMPRLNLVLSRPIFSLLRSCNHINGTRTPSPLSLNIFSFFPDKGISISNDFTPFFSTLVLPASLNGSSSTQIQSSSSASSSASSLRMSKRARYEAPENVLKHKLYLCSKNSNLQEALILYEDARANGTPLSAHHYNVLLYLCSSWTSNSNSSDGTTHDNISSSGSFETLDKGFEIFKQMGIDKVAPNEATFTSLARLAVAKQDPDMAFDLVKKMKASGITPKLRSYGPALFGFCNKGDADRANDVYTYMVECEVVAEEAELSALLEVNAHSRRGDKVYEILHLLRASVRQVSEETAKIVEDWFMSETAGEVGLNNWDVNKVSLGVARVGGGWHGQGWLGKGKWNTVRAEMDKGGVCSSCGEKLVCIDLDPKETEDFASSLSSLAHQKEKKANFWQFQDWIQRYGPFDAVVDGANVGLINTRTFSCRQLNNVVSQLQNISPSKKLPLVVLHKGRVQGGPANNPDTKRLLENWRKAGALYVTPPGSNDDWYWLYGAVNCKCLLVTNDEMRDHLFQLLGNNIFPRWKEKHQVRMTVSRNGLVLHMPPPYSIVIQESKEGSWHIPTISGDDLETPRQWICATRATTTSRNRDVTPQLSKLFSAR